MTPRDIETLSIAELCEMYAQGKEQISRANDDYDLAEMAERLSEVAYRRSSAVARKASGEQAVRAALGELERRFAELKSCPGAA